MTARRARHDEALHTVHPAAVAQLRRVFEQLDLPGESILRPLGLADRQGAHRAPRSSFLAAKALASRTTKDPCLGFRLGASMRLEDFGLLGVAMFHATSFREALRIGVEHVATWEQGTCVEVVRSRPGRLRVRYESRTPSSALATTIDGQQSVVFLLGVARTLLGPSAHLTAGFACAPPRHPHCAPPPGVESHFRTADWYVEVPDDEAPRRRHGDHPELMPTLERALAEDTARLDRPRDLRTRVRALLEENLGANWRIGDVAAALGVSPRVLQQRLSEIGTCFSDELATARVEVALALLAEPGASVKEVARVVGFSDPAPFSRFLRRHTGRPPTEHRGR